MCLSENVAAFNEPRADDGSLVSRDFAELHVKRAGDTNCLHQCIAHVSGFQSDYKLMQLRLSVEDVYNQYVLTHSCLLH